MEGLAGQPVCLPLGDVVLETHGDPVRGGRTDFPLISSGWPDRVAMGWTEGRDCLQQPQKSRGRRSPQPGQWGEEGWCHAHFTEALGSD